METRCIIGTSCIIWHTEKHVPTVGQNKAINYVGPNYQQQCENIDKPKTKTICKETELRGNEEAYI